MSNTTNNNASPATTGQITPSQHEKNEWARMAKAAYASDHNDVGHRFSGAASLRNDDSITLAMFDALQSDYRAWLIGNEFPIASASPAARAGLVSATLKGW